MEAKAVEEGKTHRLRLVTNRDEDEPDMILVAVGVRPGTEPAARMGIQLGKRSELTINDMGWLDLAYAPPVANAWDPLHIAAQALRRKI